jgi:hypothetical protein
LRLIGITMKKNEKALTWAFEYLGARENRPINDYQRVVETSYSVVYKINLNTDVFYLKSTPESLFLEAEILELLHEQGCQHIPQLVAKNRDLNCFLTLSCGDESLRQLFNGMLDFKKLITGISNYTAIQRLLEKNLQPMLSVGIPDWRLDRFPSLYEKLIQQDDLLIGDGLTTKEVDQLRQHYPTCIKLCADLAAFKIPETLSHCDFQFNNMLFEKKTGEINIIDWGETVITHPFFSLNGCLWNLTYFNALKQTDPGYAKLKSECIVPWLVDYEETTLLTAFDLANQLLGIYAALGYQTMYAATHGQLKTVQEEHPGSIAGCLRSFLSHYSCSIPEA